VRALAEAQQGILMEAVSELEASYEQPQFNFPAEFFADRGAIMTHGAEFEELWVGASRDIMRQARTPEALQLLAAIQGVKSRMAAVLAALAGQDPFPRPIEQTIPATQVLDGVAAYRAQA
jgi:Ferritin-like domain